LALAIGRLVDRLGDELLAGSALAPNEDRRRARSDLSHLRVDLPHPLVVADEAVGATILELDVEPDVLFFELTPLLATLETHAHGERDHRRDDLEHPRVLPHRGVFTVGPLR